MKRIKANAHQEKLVEYYFWRTYDGQEVDCVEVRDGKIHGYEIKWAGNKRVNPPAAWQKTYPDADFTLINNNNYIPFVLGAK